MSDPAQIDPDSLLLTKLPSDVLAHIASFLPPGEAAYSLRPACKLFARERSPQLLKVPIGMQHPPVASHALLARWGQEGSSRGLTYKQRLQLLLDAARGGDAEALQQLSLSTGCLVNEEVFRTAARADQQEVCSWLMKQDCDLADDGTWVLAAAAQAGHTELCRKLYGAGFRLPYYTSLLAARAGQGAVMEWLRYSKMSEDVPLWCINRARMPLDLPDEWWPNAAYSGHLQLMRQLKGSRIAKPKELPSVAHGCPLAMLQDMVRECMKARLPLLDSQCAAIVAGALTSPTPDWQAKVTWLLTEQGEEDEYAPIHTLCPRDAQSFAALPDAEQRLGWLEGLGFGLRSCRQLMKAAVEAGRADLVSTLRLDPDGQGVNGRNYATFASELVALAVKGGQLGIAQELLRRGLPRLELDEVAREAGSTGRVDVAQWVLGVIAEEHQVQQHEQQCAGKPASGAAEAPDAGPGAGAEGSSCGQGQGPDWNGSSKLRFLLSVMMDCACQSGSLELVQWLRERGAPLWQGTLQHAAQSGNELLVEWVVEQGFDMEQVRYRAGLSQAVQMHIGNSAACACCAAETVVP